MSAALHWHGGATLRTPLIVGKLIVHPARIDGTGGLRNRGCEARDVTQSRWSRRPPRWQVRAAWATIFHRLSDQPEKRVSIDQILIPSCNYIMTMG